jgi:hypothetical protein
MLRVRRAATAICVALIICVSGGCGSSSAYTVPKSDEETRVTSPNGEINAVLTREDGGGAAGGGEWYVYIVAKGNPVVRTVPIPAWVKDAIDIWCTTGNIKTGKLFQCVNKTGSIWGLGISEKVV